MKSCWRACPFRWLYCIILDLETKFLFKYARKTFGSYITSKFGIERAASKLNHSSTRVTKEHYVVPVDTQLEIENVYQRKIKKEDRIKGVIVNKKEIK